MPTNHETPQPGTVVQGESGQLYGNIRVEDATLGTADKLVPIEEIITPDPPAEES